MKQTGVRNRKKRPAHPMVLVLLLLALMAAGCQGGGDTGTSPMARPTVTGLETAIAARTAVDDLYETTGTVRADRTAVVAARIMGVIARLPVREGDRVQAGQTLAVLDSQELAHRVRGAEMALAAAKEHQALADATWKRYRSLYEEKALTTQEMDQIAAQKKVAESEVERARAGAEEARTYEAFTVLKAPFGGVITSRAVSEGGLVGPGQPLLTLEDSASLYVEAFVDEGRLGQLRKGQTLQVFFDPSRAPVAGKIREIVPAVDPRSRTFAVKVAVAAAGHQSGRCARLVFAVGRKEALFVPTGSVVARGQLTGVYTVAPDGTLAYRLVKTGRGGTDGRTEILSGLRPGETFVVAGLERAVDGGVLKR